MEYYIEVLKKYTVFDGRATRSEYWYFVLFNAIIYIALSFIAPIIFGGAGFLLALLYALGVLLPSIGVGIRRLHDTGRSGWWLLLSLIPFGGLVVLFFCTQDSQAGVNQYGPNPKENISSSSQTPSSPETLA